MTEQLFCAFTVNELPIEFNGGSLTIQTESQTGPQLNATLKIRNQCAEFDKEGFSYVLGMPQWKGKLIFQIHDQTFKVDFGFDLNQCTTNYRHGQPTMKHVKVDQSFVLLNVKLSNTKRNIPSAILYSSTEHLHFEIQKPIAPREMVDLTESVLGLLNKQDQKLTVVIDFTGSNILERRVLLPESQWLHSPDLSKNYYHQFIRSAAETFSNISQGHPPEMRAFGYHESNDKTRTLLNDTDMVAHIKASSNVRQAGEGVMLQAYQDFLNDCWRSDYDQRKHVWSGNTYFSPSIHAFAERARQNPKIHEVLMLLTDGDDSDPHETAQELSRLPTNASVAFIRVNGRWTLPSYGCPQATTFGVADFTATSREEVLRELMCWVSQRIGQVASALNASNGGFGASKRGVGAPSSGFGAQSSGFGAQSSGFGVPSSGFGVPSGFSAQSTRPSW